MSKSKNSSNTKEKQRIYYPQWYKVIMHNDDVTTMEFVVMVLRNVFYKSPEEATQLMLDVHHHGQAVVGSYSLDMAISKSEKSMQMAREQGFPFKLTVEEDNDLPF